MTRPIIAVFGSSKTNRDHPLWSEGVRLGRLLVEAGAEVATGGYAGLMEAVSEGAHAAGAEPIGVTAPAVFPNRPGANGFVRREVPSDTLANRIAQIVDMTDASVAMPGSLGTLAELTVAWNAAFVAPFRRAVPKPVIAIGPEWRLLIDRIVDMLEADPRFVTCVDDVDGAMDALTRQVPEFGRTMG